jgi:hypothetical protein
MPMPAFAARWKRPEPQIDDEDLFRKLVQLALGDVELVNRAIRHEAGKDGNADLSQVIAYIMKHRRHETPQQEAPKQAAPKQAEVA